METQGLKPQALNQKPTVYDWMQEYIIAFDILSSRRSVGFAPNPISMQEMLAYIQIYGASDVDSFVKYMIVMDSKFLQHVTKEKPGTKGKT